MPRLENILCPVDFSAVSREEMKLAFEVCRAFGSRLILHHNLAAGAPGFGKAWEWEEVHRSSETSKTEAEERMRELLESVPADVHAEASVTFGPVATVLLHIAEALPADLVVLGTHGWSSDEHASVTERIMDRCPCPVLTFREGAHTDSFKLATDKTQKPMPVVVATDLSSSAPAPVTYAFELARHVAIDLHLLHVESGASAQARRKKLEEMVPSDLAERVHCHVEAGPAADEILAAIHQTEAGLLVMGPHARGFFRHFFTRDTSRAVLHRADVPVWFVPPQGYV